MCYGYFVEEIEELLYHPGDFEQALAEILDECAYDYCGEWCSFEILPHITDISGKC